jgi:hypothetical protein
MPATPSLGLGLRANTRASADGRHGAGETEEDTGAEPRQRAVAPGKSYSPPTADPIRGSTQDKKILTATGRFLPRSDRTSRRGRWQGATAENEAGESGARRPPSPRT